MPDNSGPAELDAARQETSRQDASGRPAAPSARHTWPESVTSDRSRWTALMVLCVGMLMIVLDATVVNVALPSIQSDLGFTASSLAWVVNAYLIAFGGLLLLAGRLGELLGRRKVFLVGLGVFTSPQRRGHVRHVLLGIAVSATNPGLHPLGDRAGVPARHHRDGHLVRAVYRAVGDALRSAALLGGYHLAFWIASGLVVAAIVVAVTMLQCGARCDRPGPEHRPGRTMSQACPRGSSMVS